MFRKSSILIVIFLIVSLWVWKINISLPVSEHSLQSGFSAPLNVATVRPPSKGVVKIRNFQNKESRLLPSAESLPDVPFSQKPKGNVVDFIVVNGMAIAYGDIILGKVDPGSSGDHGSFDAPTPHIWDKPEIPYVISPDLVNPGRVEKALDYLKQHTGVRFVPYSNQPDAIAFEPGLEHCYSLLGRAGGMQPIKLADGCQTQEILHEIMHALGFIHQQSRQDRDQFIDVLWSNIEQKYWSQYSIVPESFMEGERGFAFDYTSVMLYQPNAFAIRPDVSTMKTKGADIINPSQDGISEGDIRRINRLFKLE
ncbi:MAG: M12 family metallopeptidase [Bdellovibrionia bacterium]